MGEGFQKEEHSKYKDMDAYVQFPLKVQNQTTLRVQSLTLSLQSKVLEQIDELGWENMRRPQTSGWPCG